MSGLSKLMPNESDELVCCFSGCQSKDPPSLRIAIFPPSDADPAIVWAHNNCFSQARNGDVEPDDPAEHGHVPAAAVCVFCGTPLPIVGVHPYCFDVGESSPPQRFWSHAQCLREKVLPAVREGL